LNFKSKTHKTQLEDQKLRKAQEGHLEDGKTAKLTNGTKNSKPRKKQRKAQTHQAQDTN
jgi:hypothetical protein